MNFLAPRLEIPNYRENGFIITRPRVCSPTDEVSNTPHVPKPSSVRADCGILLFSTSRFNQDESLTKNGSRWFATRFPIQFTCQAQNFFSHRFTSAGYSRNTAISTSPSIIVRRTIPKSGSDRPRIQEAPKPELSHPSSEMICEFRTARRR